MKHPAPSSSRLTPEQVREIESVVLDAAEKALDPAFFLLAVSLEKEAGRWGLGLYVEARQGMIALDDCARISRDLEPLIEALPFPEGLSYSLEVSSPGLFRPLRTRREIEFYLGRRVSVEMFQALPKKGGKRKRGPATPAKILGEGTLQSFNEAENCVTLLEAGSGRLLEFVLGEDRRLRLNPEVRFPDGDEESGDERENHSAVQYENNPNDKQEAYAND